MNDTVQQYMANMLMVEIFLPLKHVSMGIYIFANGG